MTLCVIDTHPNVSGLPYLKSGQPLPCYPLTCQRDSGRVRESCSYRESAEDAHCVDEVAQEGDCDDLVHRLVQGVEGQRQIQEYGRVREYVPVRIESTSTLSSMIDHSTR